jgi:hypothetical protein
VKHLLWSGGAVGAVVRGEALPITEGAVLSLPVASTAEIVHRPHCRLACALDGCGHGSQERHQRQFTVVHDAWCCERCRTAHGKPIEWDMAEWLGACSTPALTSTMQMNE